MAANIDPADLKNLLGNTGKLADALNRMLAGGIATATGGGGGGIGSMFGGAAEAAGNLVGQSSGAVGAAIGTLIAPGIGTVIGEVIGKTVGQAFQGLMDTAAALARAFDALTQQINQISAAALVSGGTGREVASLGAFGVSAGQAAGTARQFRQTVTGGGMGTLALSRLGLAYPGPEITGDVDQAKLFEQALRRLQQELQAGGRRRQEAVRTARMANLENILPGLDVSPEVQARRERGVTSREAIIDETTGKAARDLTANFAELSSALTDLAMSVIKPFLPDIKNLTGFLADTARAVANWVNHHQRLLKMLVEGPFAFEAFRSAIGKLVRFLEDKGPLIAGLIGTAVGGPIAGAAAYRAAKGLIEDEKKNAVADKAKEAADKLKEALDNNTNATNANTYTTREGIFGGGERARGAFPHGLRNLELERGVRQGALRLGAYRI